MMKDEKLIFKKTTIIYIIAIVFLLFALNDLVKLLTDSGLKRGFLGLDLGFTMDGQEIDIMGWVGVFVQLYIGYHLFRLNSEGRSCAVTILWIWTIGTGIGLLLSIGFLVFFSVSQSSDIKLLHSTLDILNYSFQIDNVGVALLIVFMFSLFFGLSLNFLNRRDVKEFFENREKSKEIP